MKRAYADLAWAHHPDRVEERDASALESARWRMQEVNEAWVVLRSPARRAAYDDELARQANPAPSEAPRLRAMLVDDDRLVVPTPLSQRPGADEGDGRGGCGVFVAVTAVLMVGVMVIAAVAAWMSTGVPDTIIVRTREKYAVGTCVLATPSGAGSDGSVSVQEVPCSGAGPMSGKVRAKVKLPSPCPRDTAAVVVPAEQMSLCVSTGS